jgi:type II secretory pathway component PulK
MLAHARNNRGTHSRPGYVLLAVLMVIVVLSLVGYRFADSMSAEYRVSHRTREAAQVKAFAVSGIYYAMGALADPTSANTLFNDYPFDNESAFSNITVGTDPYRGGGRFAIVRVEETNDTSSPYAVKYGVTDEAGKINLNTMMRIDSSGEALRAMLILLPNMTEDIADAITDWLDTDDDQRTAGAESGAYTDYAPRNGPINSLDELLFVQGVTVSNLYGSDRNRNGRQDPGEAINGDFTRGWADYLTVYGHELNVDTTGQPRLYLNDTDLSKTNQAAAAVVGQELADYITAYRLFTTSSALTPASSTSVKGSPAQLREAVARSIGTSQPRRQVRNSIMSMYNTRVTLPPAPGSPMNAPPIVVDCPLNNADYLKSALPMMLDKLTAKSNHELNPRINVNTCPGTLLSVLPGVTAEDVSNSLSVRTTLDPNSAEYKTGAWLVTQAAMNPLIFQQIETYVGGYTQTYRIQSIGYFAQGGPVARVEAVIDINGGQPRILYYRDLTDLGAGFTPPR